MEETKKMSTKRERETIIAAHDAKNRKMIRGQIRTFGIKGEKEIVLTWKIEEGNVNKKVVRDGDIISLPFGYIKYLNNHGYIKREVAKDMMHIDKESFKNIPIKIEDNEQRYSFRVLDVLTAEELEELEPSILVKARVDESRL